MPNADIQRSKPIPDRLFFKIGEVAEITGLKPYVLRFWESEFKELAPKKAGNNQRKYTRSEIETLLLIKSLLYDEKYTIEGAKQKLKELKTKGGHLPHKSSVQLRSEIRTNLKNIKEKLLEIKDQIPIEFINE